MQKRVGTIVAIMAVLLMAAPATMAGTQDAPEIADETGDAQVHDQTVDALDIERAWFEEHSDRLELSVEVASLEEADRLQALALGAEWSVAFTHGATSWRVAATPGAGLPDLPVDVEQAPAFDAQVYRDGTALSGAEASAHVEDGELIVIEWTDYEDHVPAGAVLADTHAYSAALNLTGANSVQCHGDEAVDCAPNEGYGDAYVLAGTQPTTSIDGVTVRADRGLRDARSGQDVTFHLTFDNPTDRAVSIDLDQTAPDDWDPTFSEERVTVDAGATEATDLTLSVPTNEPEGSVGFSAILRTGEETARLDLVVQVRGDGFDQFAVDARPDAQRLVAEPGGSATAEVTVENDGTQRDTFNVSLSGARPEWVTVSDREFELGPGETTTLTVTVEVPSGAAEGVYTHRLTVSSTTDPSAQDTADLTTEVSKSAGVAGGAVDVPFVGAVPMSIVLLALAGVLVAGVAVGRWSKGREDEKTSRTSTTSKED